MQEDYDSFVVNNRQAVEEVFNLCRSNFFTNRIASTAKKPTNNSVEELAYKCVSLDFLVKFYEIVVKPFSPSMTVREVVELIVKPATEKEMLSFIDIMCPGMFIRPTAFVSHAFGTPFHLLVDSLISHFRDALPTEMFIWIDVFTFNQHNSGHDLHGGLTLKVAIDACQSVIVVLDRDALPLKRLWCLYEIGCTPPEKLIVLTQGFGKPHFEAVLSTIDANEATCFDPNDTKGLRAKIRRIMVEQKAVTEQADETQALTAFSRILKLRLISKSMMSYAEDLVEIKTSSPGNVLDWHAS